MAPSEFFVRLQKGITGGFAPPTPSAIYEIQKSSDSEVRIHSQVRPDGQPELGSPAIKTISASRVGALAEELETILKDIPIEYPPGSEDIYGFDTGIVWGSNDFEWSNGGPAGCGGGSSEVQANEQQKKSFKRAIKIVEEIVNLE